MLVCATLWSIAGIFIKLIPWNGFAVAGLRSLIAGLTIAVYMLISRRRYVFNKRTLAGGIFAGSVYTCFTVANKLTTAANAIVLQFTCPVFIVIFSALFLRQKIRRQDLAVVIATLAGIALFFFDQLKPGYILGNFVGIAAGMFMAGMFIVVGNIEADELYKHNFAKNTSIRALVGDTDMTRAADASRECGFAADIDKTGDVYVLLANLGDGQVLTVYVVDETIQLAFIQIPNSDSVLPISACGDAEPTSTAA